MIPQDSPLLLGYTPAQPELSLSALALMDEAALTSLLSEISEKIKVSGNTIVVDEAWKLLSSLGPIKSRGTSFTREPWERSQPKYLTVGGEGPELVHLLDVLAEPSTASWLPTTEPGTASAVILEQSESGVLVSVEAPYSCAELSKHFNQQFPALNVSISLSPAP